MSLPRNIPWQLANDRWATQLDNLLGNPSVNNIILKDVSLANGVTTVNHRLGRNLQGWRIVRQRAQAQIWDGQDNNQTPQLTLILHSNAAVSVDLEVF